MEIIRDWGLDIKAECGGACACATCHVHVSADWIDKLHPINAEEEDMLDQAFDVRDNSRLSCQLLMSEALDGLEVHWRPARGRKTKPPHNPTCHIRRKFKARALRGMGVASGLREQARPCESGRHDRQA
jgi:2Fe-2S ferredoxin